MADSTTANNKRIAKNTLLLYFRMILIMFISLYTSRVILKTLGVEDYGIYNVVGGIVAMFSFIGGVMLGSTQRYITYELGKGDEKQLRLVFSTSIIIHACISAIIFILTESIGVWFLFNELNIPENRIEASFWVLQFSILTSIVTVMSSPYNAVIVAHERMKAFAYISILEVTLKLLIVYLLLLTDYDKLIVYAALMFVVQLGIRMVYNVYCNRHFGETKFKMPHDSILLREMVCFMGWNLWGGLAYVICTQGINILLNMFFTPVVNAARGIAVQVQSVIVQFSHNFQVALNPQIVKTYAKNEFDSMHKLIFRSTRFTFFLLLLIALPLLLERDLILDIWLDEVPEYTSSFVLVIICSSIMNAISNPLMTSATATGKVKLYQSLVGGLLILNLPISYIVLKMGGNPVSVFIIALLVDIIAWIVRLLIIRSMIRLSLAKYFREVIVKCIMVAIIVVIPMVYIKSRLTVSLVEELTIVVLLSSVLSLFTIYIIGLDKGEKNFIHQKFLGIINRYD